MRRPQPGHSPAFLIDQHRRIRLTQTISQFTNEVRYLIWSLDIAFEQDEAPWPRPTDEFALRGGQYCSGYAGNEGACAHKADYPDPARGSRNWPIILRDKALSPGAPQLGHELDRLLPRPRRPGPRARLAP